MAGFSGVKNGNGKRERGDQEDDPEFMPLSKRINNIHLSPDRVLNGHGGGSMGPSTSAGFTNPNSIHHRPPPSSTEHLVISSEQLNNVNVPDYSMGANERIPSNIPDIQYRPSLSQHANPHYYEANRALFDLYIERQIRNNQTPHPNVFGREPNGGGSNSLL